MAATVEMIEGKDKRDALFSPPKKRKRETIDHFSILPI
jgi:hypothetical protein